MNSHQPGTIVSFRAHEELIRFFVSNPEDEIQKYHYDGQFYEKEELDAIKHFYRRGTAFADIGSNIGNHAVFAERILNAPEVIVFEPNPEAIALLEVNLALNNCRNINREFLGAPVADKVGRSMSISFSGANNLGHTIFSFDGAGPYRTVTCDFALAQRLPNAPPLGFVKIDTESMEFETLNGLVKTIAAWQPTVFVEAAEAREAELIAWVEAHDYIVADSIKRYELLRNYILLPK